MTEWQLYREKWRGGCGNTICEGAKNVCLARGSVPCDVLFVGEAPGEAENAIGKPFVGPAGKLLDRIVANAVGDLVVCSSCFKVAKQYTGVDPICEEHTFANPGRLRVAFTNLVGCIPRNEGAKADEPAPTEIRQCTARLQEFVTMARPRLIVLVGALARRWVEPCVEIPDGCKVVSIDHPAFILRTPVVQRGFLIQKATVTISNAAEEL